MSQRKTNTGGREATLSVIPGKFALSVGKPRLPEPVGFTWTKLTDVARIESGHTPSRAKEEYWNGPIPWIGIREATGNHGKTIYETSQSITELGLNNSSTRLLPAETVCLSRTASVGYVVKMGVPMATSQDFVNWVCGPEMSPTYLMYILMAEQDSVRRFSHGTTHQTMYYPEAKALNVLIPPRLKQDGIVEVLGALDEKIATNTTRAATAKNLAEAYFLEAMRDASDEAVLGDVLALEYGKSLPATKRKPGNVDVYGSGGISGTHNEALCEDPGVIVGRKGTAGAVHWARRPFFPIDTTFYVVPKAVGVSQVFSYFLLRTLRLDEMNNDSAVPGLNRDEAHASRIRVPSEYRLRVFNDTASVLFDLVASTESENESLASTRDTLLPQLMSGKLRVKDAEKVLENAGV